MSTGLVHKPWFKKTCFSKQHPKESGIYLAFKGTIFEDIHVSSPQSLKIQSQRFQLGKKKKLSILVYSLSW